MKVTQNNQEKVLTKILNDCTIIRNLIGMCGVWITGMFCYHLIFYQLKYLKGDVYLNNVVSTLSELSAFLFSGIIYEFIGLKKTLVCSYLVSALGMLCLLVVKTEN